MKFKQETNDGPTNASSIENTDDDDATNNEHIQN